MTQEEEIEARFNHYWDLLGKTVPEVYVDHGIIPPIETFKAMVRSAYGMGFTEGRITARPANEYSMPTHPESFPANFQQR
jgi:hypothetical protein